MYSMYVCMYSMYVCTVCMYVCTVCMYASAGLSRRGSLVSYICIYMSVMLCSFSRKFSVQLLVFQIVFYCILFSNWYILFVYILLFCTPFPYCTAGLCESLLRGINKGLSYQSSSLNPKNCHKSEVVGIPFLGPTPFFQLFFSGSYFYIFLNVN